MSETRLHAKIAEVVAEVGYVAKDGTNTFQNYRYTSAEALLATVRGPLSKRHVALMPSLTAIGEREYTTSKGKASVITTAHVKFTFVDGETGEQHECDWAGQGDDPADKGLGKAYTNAIKTFLREAFLIPTGDDPEADSSTDERSSDRAPRSTARNGHGAAQPTAAPAQPSERPLDVDQRNLIRNAADASALTPVHLANVVMVAKGQQPRDSNDQEAATRWLGRELDRLPARLVDQVLNGIRDRRALPAEEAS